MQTQTNHPSRFETMTIDTSILNKGECARLGHICLLKLEAGELD